MSDEKDKITELQIKLLENKHTTLEKSIEAIEKRQENLEKETDTKLEKLTGKIDEQNKNNETNFNKIGEKLDSIKSEVNFSKGFLKALAVIFGIAVTLYTLFKD